MSILKQHVAKRKTDRQSKARQAVKDGIPKTWIGIKNVLQKFNIDADYPDEYLHIGWQELRIILKGLGCEYYTSFKESAQNYNIDNDMPHQYLHTNWSRFRELLHVTGIELKNIYLAREWEAILVCKNCGHVKEAHEWDDHEGESCEYYPAEEYPNRVTYCECEGFKSYANEDGFMMYDFKGAATGDLTEEQMRLHQVVREAKE